jgi:hypothetical protein
VKAMLHRGDRQHDIAAWFGVNGGRIAEISTGNTFASVPMATGDLPPKGPYLSGKAAAEAKQKLITARAAIQQLLDDVDEMIAEI